MEEPPDCRKKTADNKEQAEPEANLPGCNTGSRDESGVGCGRSDPNAADG